MPEISRRDAEVFASIFRVGGESRRDIRWSDFVQAMKHIGIDCRSSGKRGGSGRTFSVQTETGKLSMRVDEPHDRVLTAQNQASMANRLNEHFGLEAVVVDIMKEYIVPPPEEE